MYCRNCGIEINEVDNFCSKCGARAVKLPILSPLYRNPGLSAVISTIIPGLGQIYSGQIVKGIAFVMAMMAVMILISSPILVSEKVIISSLYLILWAYNIFDAHKSAEKINSKIE